MASKVKKKSGSAGQVEWEEEIDVRRVRFMHSKIRPVFSDGKRVEDTLAALLSGELDVCDLPKIVVVRVPRDQPVLNPKKGRSTVVNKPFAAQGKKRRGQRCDDHEATATDAQQDDDAESAGDDRGRRRKNKGAKAKRDAADASAPRESADSDDGDDADYFSLNNRRLYVFKALAAQGRLERVLVRMRSVPLSPRLRRRYDPARCALTATFFREHDPRAQEGDEGDEPDDDPDAEDDDDADADDAEAAQ